MFKDLLRGMKTALQNDLKTSYFGKNPSVVGNFLMGEPLTANTRWGKPKEYKQEPFKKPDGTMWYPPEMKKKMNQDKLNQAGKSSPKANPFLNLLKGIKSGGLTMNNNQQVLGQQSMGTSARKSPTPTPSPRPTAMPTPTAQPTPTSFDETLNHYIFPHTREAGIPDQLAAAQTAYESGRGTSPAAMNQNNYHGIMQWDNAGNRSLRDFDSASQSAKMYAQTVKSILNQKGYDLSGMTSDEILRALQTGTPRYEGDNADPFHYVNYMKQLKEYNQYR